MLPRQLFRLPSSSTSLRSCISSIGWRLRSGSLSSVQFSCTSVSMGLHLHTSSTSSVRWQMSRLVSDYVPARLLHWSSAAPDCLLSATELIQSPLLVSGTVCLNMSPPHLSWLSSSSLVWKRYILSRPFVTVYSARAVTLVAMDTPIVFVTYLLTYSRNNYWEFVKTSTGNIHLDSEVFHELYFETDDVEWKSKLRNLRRTASAVNTVDVFFK